MSDDKNLNLDNKTTEQQAAELLGYSNKIINDAMATCDIPAFTPVELEIPSAIGSQLVDKGAVPATDNYFASAENIWQSLVDNSTMQNSQVTDPFEKAPPIPDVNSDK